MVLTAHQDEPIDALLWRVFGSTAGVVALLEANPGIAERTHLLEGAQVQIPADMPTEPPAPAIVQLWT